MTERELRNRMLLLSGLLAAALTALSLAFVFAHLSPRLFASFGLILAGVFFVLFWMLFRRASNQRRSLSELPGEALDERTRKSYRSRILVLKVGVALMLFGLVYGNLTPGTPLYAHLVGSAVNLLMTYGLIVGIRKLQRQLR